MRGGGNILSCACVKKVRMFTARKRHLANGIRYALTFDNGKQRGQFYNFNHNPVFKACHPPLNVHQLLYCCINHGMIFMIFSHLMCWKNQKV